MNPEWLAWRDDELERAKEELPYRMSGLGIDPAMYFPEDYEKAIPKDGCWILILEEPYTELRARFRVPLLSMWHCRPHELNDGGYTYGTGSRKVHVTAKQAVIATPGGDLHLWPHEYSIVSSPRDLVSQPEAKIHSLGGEPLIDENQLFYLQSRGIAHEDAVLMLFDQVRSENFIYVTFPEEITAMLKGVGQPLWRHIQRSKEGARS